MKRLVTLAVVLGVAPVLAAPTPGAVGDCGGDDRGAPADLQSYCIEREDLTCVRRWHRNEINETQMNECRYDARETCARRTWSADCRPTERQASACLNALASSDTLDTPEDEIEECSVEALCTVKPLPEGPRSIGDGDAGSGMP